MTSLPTRILPAPRIPVVPGPVYKRLRTGARAKAGAVVPGARGKAVEG